MTASYSNMRINKAYEMIIMKSHLLYASSIASICTWTLHQYFSVNMSALHYSNWLKQSVFLLGQKYTIVAIKSLLATKNGSFLLCSKTLAYYPGIFISLQNSITVFHSKYTFLCNNPLVVNTWTNIRLFLLYDFSRSISMDLSRSIYIINFWTMKILK